MTLESMVADSTILQKKTCLTVTFASLEDYVT
jgi:hypothetical protein